MGFVAGCIPEKSDFLYLKLEALITFEEMGPWPWNSRHWHSFGCRWTNYLAHGQFDRQPRKSENQCDLLTLKTRLWCIFLAKPRTWNQRLWIQFGMEMNILLAPRLGPKSKVDPVFLELFRETIFQFPPTHTSEIAVVTRYLKWAPSEDFYLTP